MISQSWQSFWIEGSSEIWHINKWIVLESEVIGRGGIYENKVKIHSFRHSEQESIGQSWACKQAGIFSAGNKKLILKSPGIYLFVRMRVNQ